MSLFGFSKRPSVPSPKPSQPPPSKPRGLFGEKKYLRSSDLREFAKKAPYQSSFGKKLGTRERMELMDSLQKYSGGSYGVSEQNFDMALKKMQKEETYTKDFAKKKELKQNIKMLKEWMNGK